MPGQRKESEIRSLMLRYILSRGLEEGDALPSIRAFSKMFQVSTRTVQKAVASLKEEGLIEAKQGAGLFVKAILSRPNGNRCIGLLHINEANYIQKNPFPGQVVGSLRARLDKTGHELCPFAIRDLDLMFLAETIRQENLAGIILMEIDAGFILRDLHELRLPVVSMDYDLTRFGITSVVFDNHVGALDMTRHLVEQGHRSIAFVQSAYRQRFGSPFAQDTVAEERLEGYRLAMHMAGLEPQYVRGSRKDGKPDMAETIHTLLKQTPECRALLCENVGVAHAVMDAIQGLGISVPDDISVACFGCADGKNRRDKALTSVWLDYERMGSIAARHMLSALQGVQCEPERCLLPTRIIKGCTMDAPTS